MMSVVIVMEGCDSQDSFCDDSLRCLKLFAPVLITANYGDLSYTISSFLMTPNHHPSNSEKWERLKDSIIKSMINNN